MSTEFIHQFEPAPGDSSTTLLLLHGTGGNERDLLPLGRKLSPEAALLSPRGQVSERGAPRFFRRIAEGVLDLDDWRTRSADLAAFVEAQCAQHRRKPENLIALGYSNGANIAQGLLLLHPEVLTGAILLRPMFVTQPEPRPCLAGKKLLILSGRHDPLMQPGEPQKLLEQYHSLGADVRLHTLEASHALTPEDLRLAGEWLAIMS